MRKVTIELKIKLQANMEEGVTVSELIEDLDYEIESQTAGADVVDTEIVDYEVTDSR